MPEQIHSPPVDGMLGFDLLEHGMQEVQAVFAEVPLGGITGILCNQDDAFLLSEPPPWLDQRHAIVAGTMEQKKSRGRSSKSGRNKDVTDAILTAEAQRFPMRLGAWSGEAGSDHRERAEPPD